MAAFCFKKCFNGTPGVSVRARTSPAHQQPVERYVRCDDAGVNSMHTTVHKLAAARSAVGALTHRTPLTSV